MSGDRTACFVVTGASGFIGRSVCEELARQGRPVVAVSRQPGAPVSAVVSVPVRDYRDTPCPVGAVLVHLAECARIAEVDREREEESRRVLESLLAKGFGRTIYVSSGAVYARAARPLRPGDPVRADSPYARAKLANESRVIAAGGVVLRLGNVYGPGMRPATLLMEALDQIGRPGPIAIRDPRAMRDYLWIGDAALGIAAAAEGAPPGTYNLGTGIGTSAGELARRALAALGARGRTIAAGAPASAVDDRIVLDSSASEAAFGWRARVALDEGLSLMLARPSKAAHGA
ncbi:MAG: NAD-dependent epimerase/dehydratase family protein [Alphaproteobacteria bacterium]